MTRKMRSTSQFYPDLEALPVDALQLNLHSQTGVGYKLAELGSLDEFYDRLAKYDIDDIPLNREKALDSINYFLNQIGRCKFVDIEEAYQAVDKSKSVGFGAKSSKIFSRADPNMKEYMMGYVNASLDQTHQVIINASQKDEVRPVEELTGLKTPRLFTAFPPEHTFLCSIVLGDFLRQFLQHRFCVDGSISSVGDSIQNGAAIIYKTELSKREFLYCSDTSAQDASIPSEYLEMVYDQIKLKYDLNEDENSLFEAVRHNSINKLVNVNGDLYKINRGLGSGDYLTIVINIMWRLYMLLENYKHDYDTFYDHNTAVICGDDLAMSSDYDDLDLSSKYAKITWAGHPITWEEMEFCSVKFSPNVHHDPHKVLSILYERKKKIHCLSPELELQRLGGLLRVHTNVETYRIILEKMLDLVDKHPELKQSYFSLYASYNQVYSNYNKAFRSDFAY